MTVILVGPTQAWVSLHHQVESCVREASHPEGNASDQCVCMLFRGDREDLASAILQLQSLFVSLYQFCFLEMDGYHVLVEWLGLPTLNHDAVRFVRESLWARLRNLDTLSRRERIYVAYFTLSLVSVTALVVGTVWFLVLAGES